MKIDKLLIRNYKMFENVTIDMNDDVNIFVGENDSGKTTILEALSIVLTAKLNGGTIISRLSPDWFNYNTRKKYRDSLETQKPESPPMIVIEAYLGNLGENDTAFKNYKGTNNILREDCCGVKIEIKFNDEYCDTYKQLIKEKRVSDIPVELYKVEFRSFANPEYYVNYTAKKVAYIDATKKDYGTALNRFVSTSISEYLTDEEKTNLRIAYRGNRREFTESIAVKNLNEKLQSKYKFKNKTLSLNLRENEIDSWKNEMSLSLDEIPFENAGFGTQNIIKSEIFLQQNLDVDIIVIEEPENNLSFTNMSLLISKFSENADKQIFISTHSSFVANRLGLNNLHLVANRKTTPFKSLNEDTYEYFLKLPGYNTLRLLLANQTILVEGPADELIIQRAYIDHFGKQPIKNGVDVMSVGGIAFKRYCELAKLIGKKITIVPDNDGSVEAIKEKYKDYEELVNLCCENDNELNTLEPSVLSANREHFDDFKKIIYEGKHITSRTYESIRDFMKNNKTEWAMRVFLNDGTIQYPFYIKQAIGVEEDEE
jgi:putative ATP-dependent endonuclease of OLD family